LGFLEFILSSSFSSLNRIQSRICLVSRCLRFFGLALDSTLLF